MNEFKKDYIIDALGELEDRYVAEAAEYLRPKAAWKYWRELGTVAACLVTVILTGASLRFLPIGDGFYQGSNEAAFENLMNDAEMAPESTEKVEHTAEQHSSGIQWEVVFDAEESPNNTAQKEADRLEQAVGQPIGKNEEYKQNQCENKESPSVMEITSISEWLSPEQILEQGRDIFMGTVTRKQIYRVTEGLNSYFTVLTVEIEDSIRGDLTKGLEYTIYLPVAADDDRIYYNSMSGDLLKLEVGSRAIFMPITATAEKGEAGREKVWLSYADFADYFYEEGMRYLFLETETGVSYAEEVYEISGESTVTLEDVAEYIRNVISE